MNLDLYFDMLKNYDGVNDFISTAASNYAESGGWLSFNSVEESHGQVFSLLFLTDASLSVDSFQDLLAYTLQGKEEDQSLGSTSGIRAFALRNFNLEVMELENTQNHALAKLPMLKLGEYEM
ncbi:hypothetical protein Tco_0815361 [Tanacetum coccineum]